MKVVPFSRPEEQVLDDTDRYGIEVALQLKEKFDAEVIVLSMGKLGTQKRYSTSPSNGCR